MLELEEATTRRNNSLPCLVSVATVKGSSGAPNMIHIMLYWSTNERKKPRLRACSLFLPFSTAVSRCWVYIMLYISSSSRSIQFILYPCYQQAHTLFKDKAGFPPYMAELQGRGLRGRSRGSRATLPSCYWTPTTKRRGIRCAFLWIRTTWTTPGQLVLMGPRKSK